MFRSASLFIGTSFTVAVFTTFENLPQGDHGVVTWGLRVQGWDGGGCWGDRENLGTSR